jgi:hypothetical protein
MTSGQSESPEDDTIMVFPNPTAGQLSVAVSKPGQKPGHLVLYSASGRKIRQHELKQNQVVTMDIGDLPGGIYVLQIQMEDHVMMDRILLFR